MRIAIWLAAWAWTSLVAGADTLVVDDDGGAGVAFTDLPQAIAAASNGDVVLVRDGSYSGFVVEGKRLAIVGQGTVLVQGPVAVRNQGTKRCELSSLTLPSLSLENCGGAIFLDALTILEDSASSVSEFVYVDQCADVRMRDSTVAGDFAFSGGSGAEALYVRASRLEVSSSVLVASAGTKGTNAVLAGTGGGGAVLQGARLHLTGSQLSGNGGGLTLCSGGCNTPANGGTGLSIDPASEAIVAGGPLDFVAGGDFGDRQCCIGNGILGLAYDNQGLLRKSGLGPPTGGINLGIGLLNLGTLDEPIPDDPWLEVLGSPANGSFDAVLRIWGPPGHAARINLGRVPILVATPGVAVEILVAKLRSIALGPIPASGYIDYAWPQLGFFSTGTPFIAQGITVLPTGEVRRTNSAPIVIR